MHQRSRPTAERGPEGLVDLAGAPGHVLDVLGECRRLLGRTHWCIRPTTMSTYHSLDSLVIGRNWLTCQLVIVPDGGDADRHGGRLHVLGVGNEARHILWRGRHGGRPGWCWWPSRVGRRP